MRYLGEECTLLRGRRGCGWHVGREGSRGRRKNLLSLVSAEDTDLEWKVVFEVIPSADGDGWKME